MKKTIKRGLSMLFVVAFLVSAMSVPVSAAKRVSVTKKAMASQKVSASLNEQNKQPFSAPYPCNIATALDMNTLLDAHYNGKTPGTNIAIWEANWKEAQDFTLEYPRNKDDAQEGWYLIKGTASGLYVDLEGGSAEDGANVALHKKNGGDNQLWKFTRTSWGYFIQNRVGTYLTAGTSDEGHNVYCSQYTGASNQRWFVNRSDAESWIEFDAPVVWGNKATINFRYLVHSDSAVVIDADASDKSRWDFTFSNGNYVRKDSAPYGWETSAFYGSATLTAISKTGMIEDENMPFAFRLFAQDSVDSGVNNYWIVKSLGISLKEPD